MPHGIAPRRLRSRFQTLQRKQSRGDQIPIPVLVMNRERLGRFTPDVCRAAWHVEQLPPPCRRHRRTAGPAEHPARGRAARRHESPAGSTPTRATDRLRMPRSIALAARRIARSYASSARAGSPARSYTRPSARASRSSSVDSAPSATRVNSRAVSAREGQQVEPVVLEHVGQRLRVAAPHELEVARRNLEPGHVAVATCSQQLLLEGDQRAAERWIARPRSDEPDEARPRAESCAHGDVSRWNRYRVSMTGASNDLPLKVTRAPARARSLRHQRQHPALSRVVRHEVLFDDERPVLVEPRSSRRERRACRRHRSGLWSRGRRRRTAPAQHRSPAASLPVAPYAGCSRNRRRARPHTTHRPRTGASRQTNVHARRCATHLRGPARVSCCSG